MKRILLGAIALAAVMVISPARAQKNQPPQSKADKPPLTEEQRAQKEQELNDAWNKLPLETKTRIMRLHRALMLMPPEERTFLHDRMERFLNMSPAERERIRQNVQRWQKMSPEERQKAREQFHRRRQAFEQQWRQEHPGEEPPPFPYGPHSAPPPPAPPPPLPPPPPETKD